MPSLKEVKTRILSVQSTRKITSAMKMVASSKLHRAQQVIENLTPYQSHLNSIVSHLTQETEGIETIYTKKRENKRIAIVPIASNSSLCGGFNQEVIRSVKKAYDFYENQHIEVFTYPIGKKISEAIKKMGIPCKKEETEILNHVSFDKAAKIAQELMNEYTQGGFDQVLLIYQHFKNTSSHQLKQETFLPLDLNNEEIRNENINANYIVEPSSAKIIENLIPAILHLKIYVAICDSLASEHSARVMAMQVATDNADKLLQDLTLTYNKTRQQAITNELLDIVGGTLK